MDNLTHSLFALTLARTPLSRAGRGTTAALLLASNAPDIDFVSLAGAPGNYLRWHRGPTHGPLGVLGLAIVTAGMVTIGRELLGGREQAGRMRRTGRSGQARRVADAPASFLALVAVSIVGLVCHVLMDLPTTYGTRLLSPFDWHWYSLDWLPIVDVYLLGVLAAGLYFGRVSVEAGRRNALIALAFMAGNYGLHGAAHQRALDVAPRLFGRALPPWCDEARKESGLHYLDVWPHSDPPPQTGAGRCLVDLAAFPSFTSPFSWRIVARMSNAYEIHDIDLLDSRLRDPDGSTERFWRMTLRYPNVWTPSVTRAAETPLATTFLGFSRFPDARTSVDPHGATTVRFTDVRFAEGRPPIDQRRIQPFTVTVELDRAGNVTSARLGS